MSDKASGEQSQGGINGSGALSHVYIQHPPLRCNVPGVQGLYYDDGNKLILAPSSDHVLSWKVGTSSELDPPSSDFVGDGPVLFIRYSLDAKLIGIQRSHHEIQFKNRETGQTFSYRCKTDSERILGFFWTDCPSCDIILIKTSGIDLLSYEPDMNSLRLVEAKRFSVSWYVYTHESRMVFLAFGMQCTMFYGFQFSSGGIVRLPKFEMTMAKSEANHKPVLASEDVHIVTIYGRIYCLQCDRVAMRLNLYRFYRDAVVQQGALPIYSSKVAVSVIDNVLLIHQVDAKVVIMYDIFLDSLSPISAPLPLLLRRHLVSSRQGVQVEDSLTSAYSAMIYGDNWIFLVPDLICDIDNSLLWRISLDLESIAASSSDVPSILEFLQRRRSDPSKIKTLCLRMMCAIILERRPISIITRAIDVLVTSYSYCIRVENAFQGGNRSSKRTENSSGQIATSSNFVSAESSGETINRSKSIIEVAENKSKQSMTRGSDDEHVNHAGNSDGKGSFNSLSDGDDNPNLDAMKIHLGLQCGSSRIDSGVSNQLETQPTSVAISPYEMFEFIFAPVEEELGADPSYLIAIIVEFLRCSMKEKFRVHPDMYAMVIQMLVRSNRYGELAFFVTNKILEPSKEVALQLLEQGRQNLQIQKLGMDMLRQLSFHHDYVTILLQEGYYLEALQYARKHKVITVQPSLFLEAAIAANNSQHLAAILRFFSDFTPTFNITSEYDRYCTILSEMS
ncbi:regulator of MON1-CCZ1 complex-like [Zingiber officinale]|uniref:regulator of MON1-CCZ1 complex-like n=1 Tax=Zingiber officinale TaxID=94328 RepID=UPI001C4D40EE|nr:regulator of MON1-CCZ1 complex-like [Zingiber officinale]XP_042441045.1 regulator of MON1-CCZ1 complex-like [Zingiber officinale]XP_042441046.1 regulator of MON1-CCZ1 complex-like [Zingiber officinale]XP_042441048.1 regulator of MON1-CCZ1 complex-like [Zingiber officinale]XP_042441049.1 regulator of MON1-CCZ1 complex-like [Zingiber officinale]XP_042441050.1 regulator of MON1-CCZ1 complex-like [Zingiber officinale]XP_042441051.1 regulator of MON1-CCZ1 complex-like [Zingiber officinale]